MISASAEMYSHENEKFGSSVLFINDEGLGEMLVGRVVKPDPGMDHGHGNGSELKDSNAALAISSATETESLKKRKVDDETHNLKVDSQEKYGEKKMKEFEEEDVSKITEQQNSNNKNNNTTINAGATTNNNKKKGSQAVNSKVSDAAKPDYIHVRARRGQATDSHSLAERVRREKISERMRYLQELVPGCNKVIGKAGMLDEIINYVQSLQTQVEFLSMKLATINPGLEFDPHNYLAKEMFIPSCIAPNGLLPQPTDQFQFITFPQPNSTVALGKTTIPPAAAIQNTFMDSPSFNQLQQLTWDAELQNLYNLEYQQGRPPMFTSQPITGYVEEGHVKLEK